MLLFNHLTPEQQQAIVTKMYERPVPAGEILIREGDTGLRANELYVVKQGDFEVLQRRKGVNMRVNMKYRGDTFGELSLMYDSPRSATVAAIQDAVVWVLDRDMFRQHVQQQREDGSSQLELFLNQVGILSHLSKEQKIQLLDVLEEVKFKAEDVVIREGDPGDFFYIIKSGEATVLQTASEDGNHPDDAQTDELHQSKQTKRINQLFAADFFGESALLESSIRKASVIADTDLVCLKLDKQNFDTFIAPMKDLLLKEKSPQMIGARLMKIASFGGPSRQPAMVQIKRKRYSNSQGRWVWEMVRAVGHLDEVWDLNTSAESYQDSKKEGSKKSDDENPVLSLVEGVVLGSGAFSRVSVVTEEETSRAYALKRIRKTAVMRCPEHIYSEQSITRNLTHPFCIRQYGSFQDKYHLYFLFDLMTGGDLMDVLVSDAAAVSVKVPGSKLCMAKKVKILRGLPEDVAKFYIASIALALEYLHDHNIVYRDLKPENVFIDQQGYPKLGDFGFAKVIKPGRKTYTFCGTPGYVAPENVLAHGYGKTVDFWGLGVVMYVLLTGRQPFTSPKTDDQMEIMRRIVDSSYKIPFPPYISKNAKSMILSLLERKVSRRLGCLAGGFDDIKRHPWLETFDWDALAARKMAPPRNPKDDAAKRIRELAVSENLQLLAFKMPHCSCLLTSVSCHVCSYSLQNSERKGLNRSPKESKEDIQEANRIFEEF